MLHRGADWLARRERIPTSLRAVFGYYGDAGVFDYRSLLLKQRVDSTVEGMIDDAFADIEEAIAAEFGHDYVEFAYDTKLVLPAKLTLGYLYRHLDESEHYRAEELTQLAVEALLDGDMRDAINDDEFDDFAVDFSLSSGERRTVAEIAQATLQTRVDEQFARQPDAVRDHYEWAVERSEAHQDQDSEFRAWMAATQDGDEEARERVRDEYKHAGFEEQPALFTDEELDFPYLKTQYDRVGVIYDAMIEMYRAADLPVADPFKRSIVLAIIGAQIWLDDIDDYAVDMQEGQLTPVTAEYLLASDERAAYENVVDIGRQYLDRAKREATTADSALTGIATEYIVRDGTPETLPRS